MTDKEFKLTCELDAERAKTRKLEEQLRVAVSQIHAQQLRPKFVPDEPTKRSR